MVPGVVRQALDGMTPSRRIVVRARSAAPGPVLWRLLADPRHWAAWAPHIAAVTTLDPGPDAGPVRVGQRLRVRSVAGPRVDAVVTLVDPGRRWDFRVALPGPWRLTSRHDVRTHADGSEALVALWIEGPAGTAGLPALLAYRPLAQVAVRRLARLAAQQAHAAAGASTGPAVGYGPGDAESVPPLGAPGGR